MFGGSKTKLGTLDNLKRNSFPSQCQVYVQELTKNEVLVQQQLGRREREVFVE